VPRIVPYPHPALRYLSRPVTQIDDDLRASVRAMFDLMYEARGIGLAANQVALPFRFFILNLTADPQQPDEEMVFINPVIVKRHSSIEDEEGCLSFPGLYTKVRRAKRIRVRGFNLEGLEIDMEAEDLPSRAIQHELDHVDGKLYIDYAGPLARMSFSGKLRDFETRFRQAQTSGAYPCDEDLVRRLDAMPSAILSLAQLEEVPIVAPPPPVVPATEPAGVPAAEPAAG
jgi:peptide deformylase